jgi:hypothetical protein
MHTVIAPIDYSTNVQSPFQAALQGYQGGAAIRGDLQQQQQQQAAAAQQQALQKLYAETAANPTADNYSRLMLADPKASEGIQRAWTVKNTQQQQAHTSDLLQWGAAIKSGKPAIAAQQLRQRAELMEQQSGTPTQESQALRTQAQIVEEHPEFALGQIQAMLAANPNGKDAAETLGKFGSEARAAEQAPGALRKVNADATAAEADATTKGVQAKFAESQAIKDLELKGWNIKAIQEDIGYKKEANRIAAMNAAANKAGNDLKREELSLKVQEARSALDDKIRNKAADYEAGQATLQDALNLLTEIRADPDTLAAATGSLAFRGAIPGTKARTVAGKIEQLQNTLAASHLDKLKGAISDKDIVFLKNIASSLDRYQSESGFVRELGKIEEILIRSDKQMRNKFGGPKKPAPAVPSATEGAQGQRNVTVDW